MEMQIEEKALKGKRGEIFYLLLKEPGFNVTELAKRIGIKQPSMTAALQILEENKYVRVEFDAHGQGIKKKYYPSYRGLFEKQAITFKIEFSNTDEVYDAIDEVILNPEIKKIWLPISEKTSKESIMSMVLSAGMMVFNPNILTKIKTIVEKNRKLQMAWNKGIKIYADELRKKFQL